MALTINTNIPSLIAQRNLSSATNALSKSIERMTTGYKINSAQDNAAGYSIVTTWSAQLSSYDVASDNAAIGADLLTTAEDSYRLLTEHLQRIRDLTEQASNGTYGSTSLKAMQAEVYARLQEIDRIAGSTEFNGIKLMKGTGASGIRTSGIDIQVGIDSDSNSVINLSADLFANAKICGLFNSASVYDATLGGLITAAGGTASTIGFTTDDLEAFAAACSNLIYNKTSKSFTVQTDTTKGAKEMLTYIDKALTEISNRVTDLGANANRVSSATSALDVQIENLTSSMSTMRDTDIASESSNYVQQQILQQASATLLATANQMPSIALSLI